MSTKKEKKAKQPKSGYPIIIHGTAAVKAKLRRLAKAADKSMAEIVCGMIERAGGKTKKKTRPAVSSKPIETAAEAFAQ